MKLIHQSTTGGRGPAAFKVIPEEPEDLWHLYNLLVAGDKVQATTVRKVTRETGAASGSGAESERVKVKLLILAENFELEQGAEELRVRGRNLTESEYVKMGAYHTLDLGLGRPVSFEKDDWDSISAERLRAACDPAASADLAAVVLQEGLAHVCLVGAATTLVRARIEVAMPRKHGAAAAGLDKARARFHEQILQAVLRHVDFTVVRCLLVAGPGFAKEQFMEYMLAEAQKRELRQVLEARGKLLVTHASSGYKHALKEALLQPAVAARVRDTRAASEVRALDQFYEMMAHDSARAFYGPGHVRAAAELGAVQTLLISDGLFRAADAQLRRQWVALVESVRDGGGEAHVFSSAHVSGEQLANLVGIAAILRFPLPELEDQEL